MKDDFVERPYAELNARQKENHNFHKVAARLADFGYVSMRLTDDFNGADFISLHVDGVKLLRVQLKTRMTVNRKYLGKGLHIAFLFRDRAIIYPHDEMVERLQAAGKLKGTASWDERGGYSWGKPAPWAVSLLKDYAL